MKKLLVCGLALSLGACGAVTRGTTNDVTFTSEPSGAYVETSIGVTCTTTPCTLPISRKQAFVATFMLPGYQPQQIAVQTAVSGAGAAGFAGNVLAGEIVGMAVDASTGATMDHTPNPVFARMVPLAPSKPIALPRGRRQTPTS